ncbi:hypothetical protein LBMAG52_12850 [Planctomycetia bacterium]|nr:hypothetical protein LBMAG52_12850 [Planctomycetia bacterium]
MVSPKWLSMLMASAIALATATTEFAQAQVVPNDVTNPASDAGIPALLTGTNSIIRAQDLAVLQFDSLLDPSNGADPARLSAAAQSIRLNHMVAQQQVELAILYLRSNESEIIAGKNEPFNRIYGRNTVRQKVAILAPVPLPGGFNLASPSLLQARAQGGGGGGNAQAPRISVGTLLQAGDFLYLPDPTSNVGSANSQANTNNFTRTQYPNLSTNPGYVVKIAAVIRGGIQGQGGGGNNNNQNQNTDFVLDPNFGNVQTGQRALNNLTAWRVVRFEERDDPTIYFQVLSTYTAIREALAGYDPSQVSRGIQTQNRIQYSRAFQSIGPQVSATGVSTAGFYARGQANYTPLDALVATNLGITGRGADRLVRQAGLSLSDSHYHLDRLEDLGNSTITTDRKGQPVTPLLWTEDNDLPLTFNSRVQVAGATNEDRAYFRDRQTIFGDYLNNPNYTGDGVYNQFVGRAFLEELLLHAGGFADTGVASTTPLLRGNRQRRNPAGGTLQFTGGGGNTPQVPELELGDVSESGTPTEAKTLRKWQMVLSSFAEWSDGATRSTNTLNPSIFNSAFLGLLDLNGGTGLPSLRASDATSYSLFADLLNSSNSGGISFSRIEPIGKRGNAGFNPVVPAN